MLNINEEEDFALEKDNLYHPHVSRILQHFSIEILPKTLNSIQTNIDVRAQNRGMYKGF